MTTTAPRPPAPLPSRRDRRGRPSASRTRATVALAPLVARRRARDDAGLLVLAALLLTGTVLLSVALPRLQARTADEVVRQVTADAGTRADVLIRLPGGNPVPDERDEDAAVIVANLARELYARVPDVVRDATNEPVTAVQSVPGLAKIEGTPLLVRMVHLGGTDADAPDLVRWVEGEEPGAAPFTPVRDDVDAPPPAERPVLEVHVGVAAATARELGIPVGARFPLTTAGAATSAVVVVTGLYEPAAPGAAAWETFDDLLRAMPAPVTGQAEARVGLLLSDASLPDLALTVASGAITRTARLPTDPTALDEASARTVADAVVELTTRPDLAIPGGTPAVESGLPAVLDDAAEKLAAGRAQASVLVVGLATVGALALVLASRLLVARREVLLVAERARGASVASVVVRALAESVPVALVAAGAGAGAAVALVPGATGGYGIAVTVTVVAVLAPAVAAALVVRRAWTGARQPANRSDRERLARRRAARRLTGELALVAVAAAAVVSVRGRGLVASGGGDVDLLLASAPALLAAAATVLAARVLPPVLRALSRVAARRRGLVAVVSVARAARASGTAVPLLTLTTAVALVVFCGTTSTTVSAGQVTAAGVVVGAEARVDGRIEDDRIAQLRDAPGVTAVAAVTEQLGRSFGRSSGVKARLLIVDTADMARILTARGELADGWAELAEPSADGLPTLLTPDLARTAQIVEPQFMAAQEFVGLDVQGVVDAVPELARHDAPAPADREETADPEPPSGAFVVDRDLYVQATGRPAPVTAVLVDGPGARAAITAAGFDDLAGITVTEHDAWLEDARTSPVASSLGALLLASAVLLALYAAIALALTVVATSRERGRTLSALRTQGLDARAARALTLGELAPLAVVAVLAGSAIGIAVPWALTDALGLDRLTGAPGTAELRLSWVPVTGAAAVVAVSLVAAVVVESAVRRRDRLGEVLRVGER